MDAVHPYDEGVVIWVDAIRPNDGGIIIWVDAENRADTANRADTVRPYDRDVVIRVDAIRPNDGGIVIRADTIRPYDPDDAMEVIGHDDEFVIKNANFLTDEVGMNPFIMDDLTEYGDLHFTINDPAKKLIVMVGDEGDEICTRLGIIVPFQAD